MATHGLCSHLRETLAWLRQVTARAADYFDPAYGVRQVRQRAFLLFSLDARLGLSPAWNRNELNPTIYLAAGDQRRICAPGAGNGVRLFAVHRLPF